MENTAFHFFTDETGKEMLKALNDLVSAHGGVSSNELEYGVRWVTGASEVEVIQPLYQRVADKWKDQMEFIMRES